MLVDLHGVDERLEESVQVFRAAALHDQRVGEGIEAGSPWNEPNATYHDWSWFLTTAVQYFKQPRIQTKVKKRWETRVSYICD